MFGKDNYAVEQMKLRLRFSVKAVHQEILIITLEMVVLLSLC